MFKVTVPIYISKRFHTWQFMLLLPIFGIISFNFWHSGICEMVLTMSFMCTVLNYGKVMHCLTCSFTNGIPFSLADLGLVLTKHITFCVYGNVCLLVWMQPCVQACMNMQVKAKGRCAVCFLDLSIFWFSRIVSKSSWTLLKFNDSATLAGQWASPGIPPPSSVGWEDICRLAPPCPAFYLCVF